MLQIIFTDKKKNRVKWKFVSRTLRQMDDRWHERITKSGDRTIYTKHGRNEGKVLITDHNRECPKKYDFSINVASRYLSNIISDSAINIVVYSVKLVRLVSFHLWITYFHSKCSCLFIYSSYICEYVIIGEICKVEKFLFFL